MSYEGFVEGFAVNKLKFPMNERCFEFLEKFLVDELCEKFEVKIIADLRVRIHRMKINAGVAFDVFTLVGGDANTFYSEGLQPFLVDWVGKYTGSGSIMNIKAVDFHFLEIFVKWAM